MLTFTQGWVGNNESVLFHRLLTEMAFYNVVWHNPTIPRHSLFIHSFSFQSPLSEIENLNVHYRSSA